MKYWFYGTGNKSFTEFKFLLVLMWNRIAMQTELIAKNSEPQKYFFWNNSNNIGNKLYCFAFVLNYFICFHNVKNDVNKMTEIRRDSLCFSNSKLETNSVCVSTWFVWNLRTKYVLFWKKKVICMTDWYDTTSPLWWTCRKLSIVPGSTLVFMFWFILCACVSNSMIEWMSYEPK